MHPLTAGDWEVTGDRYDRALLHVDDADELLYFMATAESPLERHLYRIAFDAEDKTRPTRISEREGWHDIKFANSGEFYVDEMPSIEYGTLTAADGQALYYEFLKPAGFDADKKYPVIVHVYGGPSGQRVTRKWRDAFEHVLVNRGYLVFSLDNRGTSFRGVEFDAPLYLRMGKVEVADQLTGVEYLKSLPYVDADRLGIYGWSYGGYLTLMTMLQEPGVFAAGVAGAPVTDWALLARQDSGHR